MNKNKIDGVVKSDFKHAELMELFYIIIFPVQSLKNV